MPFILATAIAWSASVIGLSLQEANPGSGVPAKYLASCEADLTGDGLADLALLLETVRGPELIVLVPTKSGSYSAFVLFRGRGAAILSCEYGPEVRETRAGGGSGRLVRTPGAYVHVVWPESSSVAYIWQKDKFLEVWTSD